MQTLEMILTAGAKGKFSGGFDISGFGEVQKGASMFSLSWCLCLIVLVLCINVCFGFIRERAQGWILID